MERRQSTRRAQERTALSLELPRMRAEEDESEG